MKEKLRSAVILCLTIVVLLFTSSRLPADTSTCGGAMVTTPFTDVGSSSAFCNIAEAYFSGLTNGITSTTYNPLDNVPRAQMAIFVTRTQDSALRRGSRRAALAQWATPTAVPLTGRTALGSYHVASDGQDLWVSNLNGNSVSRVQASDGHVIGTWTGAQSAYDVLVARGRVFVSGQTSPGKLYTLDPSAAPGPVLPLSTTLGGFPRGITTDGSFIWIANSNSISRVDPDTGGTTPFTAGFGRLDGIIFDGTNLWVTDETDGTLKKLDSGGTILQSVPVGAFPQFPVFDGSNIWVPNRVDNSLTVVRRDGQVLATLTGNGLSAPVQAAFDGQRILVTNNTGSSVSLWKAADLSPIGSYQTGQGTSPLAACSDGINFWITLGGSLARF